MPTATNGGVDLHYETEGSGPTVVCCADAGIGAWEWSYLLGALPGTVETLVWDYRGTGRSDAPPGPYSVAVLVDDLDAVLADHGARSVHLVGSGLGGTVALEYARESGRPETLTLFGTPRSPADVDRDALNRLRDDRHDPEALRGSMDVLLSAPALERDDEVARIIEWRRRDDASPNGWDGQTAALLEHTLSDLYEVTTPVLVCHGVADALVDPAAGEGIAENLPRGRFQAVEGGHCCFVESARAVADELVTTVADSEGR